MPVKIIVTVGPSSLNEQTIKKMDMTGVDIFRINLSHTPENLIEKHIRLLQSWTSKTVCLDTEGAQLRTGEIPRGEVCFKDGQLVELLPPGVKTSGKYQIPLSFGNFRNLFHPGDLLKIDFNSALLQIIRFDGEIACARLLKAGKIGSNKGCSSDRMMKLPAFTSKDIVATQIAKTCGLDTFAFSFASSGYDVKAFRELLDYPVKIISKIESKAGLMNIESISEQSDALLIDRGDLSRDVPLEKVISAQNYIIDQAKKTKMPIYIATNLMENMIMNSKPTRAEIHDIVSTLESGATGLVLAAETAIGAYPVDCVRIMSRLIGESTVKKASVDLDYLTELPSDRTIPPHGGKLVMQIVGEKEARDFHEYPSIEASDEIISDIRQIATGIYSPLRGFMGQDELDSTLDNYSLPDGTVWTLPILFQVDEDRAKKLPSPGEHLLVRDKKGNACAVLKLKSVAKIKNMERTAEKWFNTLSSKHPGVKIFLTSGEYLISGDVFLFDRGFPSEESCYMLTPKQTRDIFNDLNWHRIVGFHTRNVPHRGHEFIQKKALERANADAIFISPVVGKKKKGDFSTKAVISAYEKLIESGIYKPYGALLGAFDTHSRYSGPREAVFTAVCRKNFGCTHFVVGRDHTGVGNFYAPDASIKMFEKLDTGIEILTFDTAYYCKQCGEFTFQCAHPSSSHLTLSGTAFRNCLMEGKSPQENLVRPEIFEMLSILRNASPDKVFWVN